MARHAWYTAHSSRRFRSPGLHFVLGIVIGYLGSVALFIDWLYASRRLSFQRRILVSSISVLFFALFSWLAFRPAPLVLTGLPMGGGYKSGTVIAGIKWDEKYSEARLIIENKSASSYTDINW
jgi:hypothetical protein